MKRILPSYYYHEKGCPEIIRINPAMKRHYELEIERDVAKCSKRCEGKLRELLKIKQRQYEKATLAEEIQPLVTEIEMLKFVLFFVCQ